MKKVLLWIQVIYLTCLAWLSAKVYWKIGRGPLERHAWQHGFVSAIHDLKRCQATQLRSLERLQIRSRTRAFSPAIPNLFCFDPDTLMMWDMGYDRAILLYQLGVDVERAFAARNPWTVPFRVDTMFEGFMFSVMNGDMKMNPERPSWITGDSLPSHTELSIALYSEYRKFAEHVQQISAAYAPACQKEIDGFLTATLPGTEPS